MDVIFFWPVIQVFSVLENKWQKLFGCCQVNKKIYAMFVGIEY